MTVSKIGGKRQGAGRKKGSTTAGQGMPTHVVRISTEVTKEQAQAIPSLIAVLDYWEDEYLAAKARGESGRTYEKMMQLIEEVRGLGF